jgi:8-oxo-dGTP diphosphatase
LWKRIAVLMREVEKMAGGKMLKVQDFDAMVVVEKGGRFLVLKRKKPPVWEFPGGAIEWGEMPEEAVRRECEEECGLSVEVGKVLGTTSAVYEKEGRLKHAVYIVFKGKVAGGKLKLSGEHSAAKWVGKKELGELNLGFNSRLALGLF